MLSTLEAARNPKHPSYMSNGELKVALLKYESMIKNLQRVDDGVKIKT